MLYTFQLMLKMVPVRDLDHFAAERGGCSALHILSVRELGTGKTIWIQVYLFHQALKYSRAPCPGKRDRERERRLPCLHAMMPLTLWPSRGRKVHMYPGVDMIEIIIIEAR